MAIPRRRLIFSIRPGIEPSRSAIESHFASKFELNIPRGVYLVKDAERARSGLEQRPYYRVIT
jgi:hypothetical protein